MYRKGNKIQNKYRKATVRPIMTYALETRMGKKKTKQMLEANEMKVLRKIVGKTRIYRIKLQRTSES